ncbi:chloride channel protein [Thauera sp.]|uniref:chloride channel protein n=1 Tax=Thauera sp. TaxID=1905334 RepID=UPI002621A111|nr:chloride channel protein [Thauera sp.]
MSTEQSPATPEPAAAAAAPAKSAPAHDTTADPAAAPPPGSAAARGRTFARLLRGGRRYALPWLSLRRWRVRLLLVGAALLAGLIAIAFAIGAELAIATHAGLVRERPWLTLLIAPAGFGLLAWISRRFFPGTEGSGIPQAIAASMSDDGRVRRQLLSLRIALAKVFLTLGGLLSGASVGREGPSVQIGASVMHLLASRKRHRRIASSRDLIVAGSGAGIAAAFNTPLGGIMFAIEEMCRYRAFQANSTTLTAVIFAGLMSLAVLGNYTYFGRTPASLGWPDGIWPVLACGVAGGLLGGIFTRVLVASSRGLPGRLGVIADGQPVAFAAMCGLLTALIGLASGGLTYGTGYAESKAALEGSATLPAAFTLMKMAVIWLVFISRIPGGIFAPALAVGAGLGADVALLLPGEHDAAMLVLGMVAFLAAMTQTPITSFVIVMEMTANHAMLLPLMATAVVAHGVARSVAPVPLYHALSHPWLRRAEKRLHDKKPLRPPPPGGDAHAAPAPASADAGALDQRL